jgi:FOG: TPR repeat, SEL1 subfamily
VWIVSDTCGLTRCAGVKLYPCFLVPLIVLSTAVSAAPDTAALRKKAEAGNVEAMVALAQALEAVESDEAMAWYTEAADRGHPAASYAVFQGTIWHYSHGFTQAEHDRLLGYLRRAAEAGLPKAQHRLGEFLESYREVDGEPVEADLAAAAQWYRKAAAQKYPDGMEAWALAQLAGSGVPKDFAVGLRDMKAAAQAGHAKAQRYLAGLFKSGEDPYENKVPVDWAESIRWRRLLIAGGDEDTLALADSLLRQPNPTAADLAQARQLIEAQVANNNPNANEFTELLADVTEKAKRTKLEHRYARFEREFTKATSRIGRERALWTYRQWLVSRSGLEWREVGEWSLRRMTPLLERHPTEAYYLLQRMSKTVISNEMIERVLPGSLRAAMNTEWARFKAAYDADEKHRAIIRQKTVAAHNGDAQAQLAVGLAYYNQDGVLDSFWAEAIHWLTLAAEKNMPGAAEPLRRLSAQVNAREKTAREAKDTCTLFELYRQKSASPMRDAHVGAYQAGLLLLGGDEDDADAIAEAVALLEKAAAKGHAEAMLTLGRLHLIRNAQPVDEARALAWMEKAANLNHPEAKAWVEVLTPKLGPAERGQLAHKKAVDRMVAGSALNIPAAMPFATYAARLGNEDARAFLELATETSRGDDVVTAASTPFAQDQAAAASGDVEAMYRLGRRYESGDGVAKDLRKAYFWYDKAALQGHEAAIDGAYEMRDLLEREEAAAKPPSSVP